MVMCSNNHWIMPEWLGRLINYKMYMKMLVTTLDYKCVLASVFTYSYKMVHLCYFEVLPSYVCMLWC